MNKIIEQVVKAAIAQLAIEAAQDKLLEAQNALNEDLGVELSAMQRVVDPTDPESAVEDIIMYLNHRAGEIEALQLMRMMLCTWNGSREEIIQTIKDLIESINDDIETVKRKYGIVD